MDASQPPSASSRHTSRHVGPRTTAGFAAIAALVAAFPVALAAIEYPLVVVALLIAASTASAVVGKRR